MQDVISDAQIHVRQNFDKCGKDCDVHSGFLADYTAVVGQLKKELLNPKRKGSKGIVIVGHSLGGAMAMLATHDLMTDYEESKVPVDKRPPITLYTFGQPRTGDKTFVDRLVAAPNVQMWRVVNDGDIVPHALMGRNQMPSLLQSVWFWSDYHHGPTEVWMPSGSKELRQCSATDGEDAKCSNSLQPWSYSFAAHRIASYIERLKA